MYNTPNYLYILLKSALIFSTLSPFYVYRNIHTEPNNTQAKWSKTKPSDVNPSKLLGGDIDLPEELILAPPDKAVNEGNRASVAWRKSGDTGTRSDGRGGVGGRDGEVEELILEPKGPREGMVAQSASWQKQSAGVCTCIICLKDRE